MPDLRARTLVCLGKPPDFGIARMCLKCIYITILEQQFYLNNLPKALFCATGAASVVAMATINVTTAAKIISLYTIFIAFKQFLMFEKSTERSLVLNSEYTQKSVITAQVR